MPQPRQPRRKSQLDKRDSQREQEFRDRGSRGRSEILDAWGESGRRSKSKGMLHPNNAETDPLGEYVPPPLEGESVVFSFRISRDEYRVVEELLAEQRVFLTKGDFGRAAFRSYLVNTIVPLRPKFAKTIQRREAELRLLRESEQSTNIDRILKPAIKIIRGHLDAGNEDGAIDFINRLEMETLPTIFEDKLVLSFARRKLSTNVHVRGVVQEARKVRGEEDDE